MTPGNNSSPRSILSILSSNLSSISFFALEYCSFKIAKSDNDFSESVDNFKVSLNVSSDKISFVNLVPLVIFL